MNEDPTESLADPAVTGPAPGTDVCPNGHILTTDQVIIRNGHKVCPICEAQSQSWAPAGPRRPPVFWRRQALRLPLIVVAIALVAEAVSSASGIATAASYLSNHLPGSTAQLISSIFDTLCQVGLAAGAAWIAYLVGQDPPPVPPDSSS